MAFCSKCGKELAEGAQFCASCGTAVGSAGEADGTKRVQKFVGEIRKCPHCGAVIEGFEAQCPQCGMELNKKVSGEIAKFKEDLGTIDDTIMAEQDTQKKKWWTDWPPIIKVGYVVLNCFTYAIPVILHFIIQAVKPFLPKRNLTPAETRKQQLIQSFVVPSNKEDIMEFLVFAKGLRDADAINSVDKKWKMVWNNKCRQIITKAKPLYPSDTKFQEFLNAEKATSDEFSKSMRIKAAIPGGALALALVLMISTCSIKNSGAGVKITTMEKSIPASEIMLQKELAKQIRITDDVKFVVDTENNYRVQVTIPIEGVNDLSYEEVLDSAVNTFLAEKGLDKTKVELDSKYATLQFKGPDKYGINIYGEESAKAILTQIRSGETKTIRFSVGTWDGSSTKEKKEKANDIMNTASYMLVLEYQQYIKESENNSQYVTIGK